MNTEKNNGAIEILLVEDSPGDARLIIELLKDLKITNKIHHVDDGIKALDFLNQEGDYDDVPKPDLILLDLNLPKMDGHEVLKRIKDDERLKFIPVVILTTSSNKEDIMETYKHHANCFITKPVDFGQLIEVIMSIENFWLTIAKLPSK